MRSGRFAQGCPTYAYFMRPWFFGFGLGLFMSPSWWRLRFPMGFWYWHTMMWRMPWVYWYWMIASLGGYGAPPTWSTLPNYVPPNYVPEYERPPNPDKTPEAWDKYWSTTMERAARQGDVVPVGNPLETKSGTKVDRVYWQNPPLGLRNFYYVPEQWRQTIKNAWQVEADKTSSPPQSVT
jgi:hypothetical protein